MLYAMLQIILFDSSEVILFVKFRCHDWIKTKPIILKKFYLSSLRHSVVVMPRHALILAYTLSKEKVLSFSMFK